MLEQQFFGLDTTNELFVENQEPDLNQDVLKDRDYSLDSPLMLDPVVNFFEALRQGSPEPHFCKPFRDELVQHFRSLQVEGGVQFRTPDRSDQDGNQEDQDIHRTSTEM